MCIVRIRSWRRSDDPRVGGEITHVEQFGAGDVRIVFVGQRIAREVRAIGHAGGGLRRQEIAAEFQHLRRAAHHVAGGRVDWNTFEVIARAVHEIAVLVQREVAATGVALDAVELRVVVAEAAGLLHGEETVAVDRHIGRDRRVLHVTAHGVGRTGIGDNAAGDLIAGAGIGDHIHEARVDALERRRLRVRDVAGNVFQCVRLRTHTRDRCIKSSEKDPLLYLQLRSGRPAGSCQSMAAFEEEIASRVPTARI